MATKKLVPNQLQNELWRMVSGRMEKSLNTGAWLEAIALQDSMINERLESLLALTNGTSRSRTLDRNIKACLKLELMDDEVEVLNKLDAWRDMRNKAMHRMVKYSESDFSMNWSDRLKYIEECALNGKALVKLTKNAVGRAKRRF